MDELFYKNEFRKRLAKLREIRKIAHPNEKPLIDDTISAIEEVLLEAKGVKQSTLVECFEGDYNYLKENSFLWEYVRKFAKMDTPDHYGDYVFEDGLDLSDDEILGLTHDFYRDATNKEFYEMFLKIYSKRNKTVGIFQNKYSDFVADSIYLPYYNDTFIQLNRKDTFQDICSLIHEYGHAIQASENYHPNLSNNIFIEIVSVFFELISFEHYSKNPDLRISAAVAQWDDYNSRVLFADDLTDEFDVIKQIKSGKKGHNDYKKIIKYTKADTETIKGFIEYNTSDSLKYVIAELIGIELYMLYRKDPEKALYIVNKIINIDASKLGEDYFKEIQKLGINPNQKVGEYQDHLLKRMKTIKRNIEK